MDVRHGTVGEACTPAADPFPWRIGGVWGYAPLTNGFGSFATPQIPVGWSGKLLFQSVALNGPDIEVSTPTVIDVN